MNWLQSPLLRALRRSAELAGFSASDWDLAIRQARGAGLLARLGLLVRPLAGSLRMPEGAMRLFDAQEQVVARQHNAVRWEVHQIARALADTAVPVVLLKGAAYAAGNSPAAAGRTFNDVDILVPKDRLSDVEHALHVHGWLVKSNSAYDDRYYRQWMHELPPMVHLQRRTTLDVHHNLLPETARMRTRPDLVLADAVALPDWPNIYRPSLPDQILHSACHLFHEGEWGHGLRDLNDLHLLLGAFHAQGRTADELVGRARELQLVVPLTYAVRCAATVFGTHLAEGLDQALPEIRQDRWMDALFLRALACAHHTLRTPTTAAAEMALYVRSHWLRMPLHQLVPHLVHQALVRSTGD